MRKLLSALAGLLLFCAADAGAANYYVNANPTLKFTGKDTNAGTSLTSAKRTLASLKTVALPGDTIYLVGPFSYTYAGFDSAGSNPTAGGVIAVFSASASTPAVITGGMTIGNPYTVVNGPLTIAGDLVLQGTADFCRVRGCTVNGSLYIDGADYSTVVSCIFTGRWLKVGYVSDQPNGDTLSTNTFTALGPGDGSGYPVMMGSGDTNSGPDSCAFLFNNYDITQAVPTNCSGCEWWGEYFRFATFCKLRGEHRTIHVPAGAFYVRRFRDNTHGNRFDCDTLIATGSGAAEFWPAVSGNTGVAHPYDNDIDSSYYDFKGCASSGGIFYQVIPNGVDITYTTVIAHEHAFQAFGAIATTLNHDTFVSNGDGGVVRWWENTGVNQSAFRGAPGLTFTNNAVCLLAPFKLNEPISPYSSQGGVRRVGAFYEQSVLDSAYALDLQTTAHIDFNAYSYWGSVSTVGDRSICVRDPNLVTYSKPGNNNAIEARYNQMDSLSVFGSFQFADSNLATFDPHPGPGSILDAAGSSGSDIGAVALVDQPKVNVEPAAVFFHRGLREIIGVTLSNLGTGDLTVATICEDRVNAAQPPEVGPYVKPTATYDNQVGWYDAQNEGTPDPADGLGTITAAGGDTPTHVVYFAYDGTAPTGTHRLYLLTNDPSVPVSTPSGCAAGRWLVIPVSIF